MKTKLLLLGLCPAFLFFSTLAAEEAGRGTFLQDAGLWKVVFPPELPADVEIVPDAFEGKPALRIAVPEGEVESWKGKVSFPASLPSAGNYTLAFYAKVEPIDSYVELSVWGSLPDQPKNLGVRQNFKVTTEWQEFLYQFSVSTADPAASITWGNLAKGGKTFFLGDIRLSRDP